jgi:signal transduction histidine kinase
MVARLFAWLRGHPQLVDLAWTLPLIALGLLAPVSQVEHVGRGFQPNIAWFSHVVLVLASCVPLVWRRRWPRSVFAVVALVALAQWLVGIAIAAHDAAVLVAMYTVVAECALRWAVAAGLVVELGVLLSVLSMWRVDPVRNSWKALIPFTIFCGAIWLCGLYISIRRRYTRSLEERAERLERERDAQVQVAAAAERARIAREMHDVIAHSISVMVVQADGAAYTVESDAKRAKRAMETIGATGRQALAEMRQMLGVLREDGEATLAPQPGVEQLTDLLAQIRSAGLSVDLTVHGVPATLPAGLQLAVYRIVQEALTNTRKHAGPGATARVGLYYGDHAIEIRIRDDGRGAVPGDGRGHGLVGMRERVAVYGGSVRAVPMPEGGFEVIARLPVRKEVKT